MKREAPTSTKMRRLCRLLDITLGLAVGTLELLWHLTARQAPEGNIGKLSNEDIALAVDWRGDEDRLIEALVRCGWLDRDEQHRLLVHDWHEHADESVKKKLTRSGRTFILQHHVETKGGNVETKGGNGNLPRAGAGPVPEPGPEPPFSPAVVEGKEAPRSGRENGVRPNGSSSPAASFSSPEAHMIAAEVRTGIGVTSHWVGNEVVQQAELELKRGLTMDAVKDGMIAQYRRYEKCFLEGRLKSSTPMSAQKFFGEAIWKDSRKWGF